MSSISFRFQNGDDGPDWNGTAVNSDAGSPGPFAHYHWAGTMRDMTDGTQNVIAMGELRPLCYFRDGDATFWAAADSNYHNSITPINFAGCNSNNYNDSGQIEPWAPGLTWPYPEVESAGFRSKHPSGAMFLYCDGSVHFLTEFINYDTYQRLADRRDARPVTSLTP